MTSKMDTDVISLQRRATLVKARDSLPIGSHPVHGTFPLECPFKFLGCQVTFDGRERMEHRWIEHSLTHFKNQRRSIALPAITKCTMCRVTFFKDSGEENWRTRMRHVKRVHLDCGQRTAQPDIELMRFLFGAKVISNQVLHKCIAIQSIETPPSSPGHIELSPAFLGLGNLLGIY